MDRKIARRIERVFKGVAHQKRVKILKFIAEENNTSLWQISSGLKIELRNASHHTEILKESGLIYKEYVGQSMMHSLTPYGEKVIDFINDLDHS